MYPVRRRSSPTRSASSPARESAAPSSSTQCGPEPGERRSDEEEQLVDEPLAKEGACEGRTAFEEERLHAFARPVASAFRPAGPTRARAPSLRGEAPFRTRACVAGAPASTSRASSRGASARTVPIPTATASEAARSSCTRRRLSSPVTQRDSRTTTAPVQRDGRLVGDERAAGGDPGPPGLVLPPC